jgi:murein L,D-transpeptidase YafK
MAQSFKTEQIKFSRVKAAFAEKELLLKESFKQKGLAYPPKRIFIRAFKREQILELWTAERDGGEFHLLKEYKICANSGVLGPKRKEGDRQVPEGFYFIDVFNPLSNYHLSMRVNYPNQSDRILGAGNRLGGDIYIHGNCVTIGCIPLTDEGIKELYPLAVEAKAAGQRAIPVHIFPARLNQEGMQRLKKDFADKALQDFWDNLIPGYDFFEKHHRLPTITVNRDGRYAIKN